MKMNKHQIVCQVLCQPVVHTWPSAALEVLQNSKQQHIYKDRRQCRVLHILQHEAEQPDMLPR